MIFRGQGQLRFFVNFLVRLLHRQDLHAIDEDNKMGAEGMDK